MKDQSDDQNWRDSLSCGEIDTTLTKGWNSNINIDYTKAEIMPLVIHDPMKQIYLVYQIPMQRNEMKYCERWTEPSLWYHPSVLVHQVIPNCQRCAQRTYLLFSLHTSKNAWLL